MIKKILLLCLGVMLGGCMYSIILGFINPCACFWNTTNLLLLGCCRLGYEIYYFFVR